MLEQRQLAGQTRLTAVSIQSLDRDHKVTFFIQLSHDAQGRAHLAGETFCRLLAKHGFQRGERVNVF